MRKSEVVLTLALLGAIAVSLWLWTGLRTQQARNAELTARVSELTSVAPSKAQVAASPAPVAASPAETNSAAPASSSTRSLQAVSSPQEVDIRGQLKAMAQRQQEMLRDPAYRKSQMDAGRRQFARTRTDAIRIVGMTPEQADRVIDLWVERNMRYSELSDGIPGGQQSESVQAELERAGDAEQAELRVLLGPETYEKWGRYLASGEERAEVSHLREQLASGKDPLRDSQADALVDFLYTERERRSNEYEVYVKEMGITDRNRVSPQDRQRWLDLEKEANQRIHVSAAGVLSSSQLKSLDEMLANRLVPVEAALRLQLEKN